MPAIAKGVRKANARLAGALELFARVDVQLAEGRNLDVLTQAVRMPGARVEADVERTAHASLVAEVADRVCEDRHPVEGLFELTALALEELARETEPRRASAYFIARALDLNGWAPNLSTCTVCDGGLPPESAGYAPEAGGLVCANCAAGVSGLLAVSLPALKVLRVMGAGDIALYRRLKLDAGILDQVEAVVEAQLEHHLDRRLKSLQFLRRLRTPA